MLEHDERIPRCLQFENCSVKEAATVMRGAVEGAIRPQDDPGSWVTARGGVSEMFENGETSPVEVQLEHGPSVAASAQIRRSIEHLVHLQQPRVGAAAGRRCIEVLQNREAGAVLIDLEDGSGVSGAAGKRRSIKHPVASQ